MHRPFFKFPICFFCSQLLLLVLTVSVPPLLARIVSPDRPGQILSEANHNTVSPQQAYSYAYNNAGPHIHYPNALHNYNTVLHKQPAISQIPAPHPAKLTGLFPIGPEELDHHQFPLAPSLYPNQLHSLNHRPVGHEPIVSVPTAPAVIRHPNGAHELHSPKISVPSASAIIRPQAPVHPNMQSQIIPYSQSVGAYHPAPVNQAPVYVVQPFTWFGKPHTGSPMNPHNKQPGMLPVVQVPTATIRTPAPAYGKVPTNHPNAIHDEVPPYLNSGIRPVILGRYGYALTNAPFKLKYNH